MLRICDETNDVVDLDVFPIQDSTILTFDHLITDNKKLTVGHKNTAIFRI